MIEIRYFASLRERMGRARDSIPAEQVRTVADLWTRASGGKPMPPNTLIAVNMEYTDADHPVREGDEVAFFPPVTGG